MYCRKKVDKSLGDSRQGSKTSSTSTANRLLFPLAPQVCVRGAFI